MAGDTPNDVEKVGPHLTDEELAERGYKRLEELKGLRERAERIGATVDVQSVTGDDGKERLLHKVEPPRQEAPHFSLRFEDAAQQLVKLEERYGER